jgi:hypothetical protein
MLRLLGIIIAKASGKPVTICGEMAGREEVIPTAPVRRRIRESLPLGCRGRQLFYQVAHEIGIETLPPLGAMIETPQCPGMTSEGRCNHLPSPWSSPRSGGSVSTL